MPSSASIPAPALPAPVAPASSAERSATLGRAYRGALGVGMLSKVAGLLRELLIAHAFGASPVASLYFSAAQVPIGVQSFFFGAFALPTVPALRAMHAGAAGARFRRRLVGWGTLAVAVAAGLGWIAAQAIAPAGMGWFLAPLFLCCVAVPAAGVVYCELLARGETTRASALPAAMNVTAALALGVGCALLGSTPWLLPVSLAVGIVFQALIARRERPAAANAAAPETGTAVPAGYGRGVGLALVENVCFAAAFFWQTQLYGAAVAGGTALFFYAYRLANFPILLFIAPAQQLAYRRAGSVRAQRLAVYGIVVGVGLASMAALAWLGPILIPVFYERGAMTAEACAVVVRLGPALCLSLLAVALVQTAGRYLSQHGRHTTYVAAVIPMYVAANLARLALVDRQDVALVALAGAGVELVAAGVLVALSLKRISA